MSETNNNDTALTPKNDYLFKRIFADEKDKGILAAFLKTILDVPEDDYDELEILNPISNIEYAGDKINVLDVKLKTKSGKIVNIEIQRYHDTNFRARMIYQVARLVYEQLQMGNGYGIINNVVCIAITERTIIRENKKYFNKYMLYDRETHSEFSDIISLYTLELSKLPSTNDGSPMWDWLKFIDSDEVSEMEAIAVNNNDVGKAVVRFKQLTADEKERMIAEYVEDQRRQRVGQLDYAMNEGLARGRKEGEAKGKAEGIAKGKAEGLAKGKAEGMAEAIEAAKKLGMSNEQLEKLRQMLL